MYVCISPVYFFVILIVTEQAVILFIPQKIMLEGGNGPFRLIPKD
jgi:hypothetical protein